MRARHTHGHGRPGSGARRALGGALALTVSFMVVEIVVGLWSGSLALLADAGHMANDTVALALSLFVTWVAARERTSGHTYGFRRAEVIGATVNGVALVAAGVWIAIEGVERLAAAPEIRGEGMLLTAIGGLVVNVVSAVLLWRTGGDSMNVRAAMLHVLGDALGSTAAIVGGVFVLAFDLPIADPIASMAIAVLIVVGAVALLRRVLRVLMQGVPEGLELGPLEATIRETEGVASVHDLHVWALVPDVPILSSHVVLEADADATDVVRRVGDRIADAHGITHTTIQPEREGFHDDLDACEPAPTSKA